MLPRRFQFGARLLFLALTALVLSILPGWTAEVRVVGWALLDNGDGDGFADSGETVELRLTLRNDSSSSLEGVQARLATDDAEIERIFNPVVRVGDIDAGATITLPVKFRFKVADVERDTVYEDFSAALRLTLTASGSRLLSLAPNPIVLQLDLDAAAAGTPGVFFEGFEDGTLGAMAPMNLDAGKFSAEASDGYRCQYADPDWIWSNTYRSTLDCWLGSTSESHGEEFFWNIVDGQSLTVQGRSFTGHHSVWMGVLVGGVTTGAPGGGGGGGPKQTIVEGSRFGYMTTPMGVLEGVVTDGPIHLAAGKICEVTRTTACQDDGDCPEGELCLDAVPELAFKHQISLPDYRVVNTSGPLRSADGGVVQAQVVTPGGVPRGDWRTLVAYQNGYDQQREDNYTNCFFDPIDDGNTEDDFYDGSVRLGPSSLCYDQWVFAYLGDTDEAFNEANVGNSDGPGLEGENGLGTWVESRFDLSAYEGQRILIRFISSGIKAGTGETYEDIFMWNPTPADDGWFIDDITVTGTMDSSDELAADEADGSAPAGRGVQVLQARPMP